MEVISHPRYLIVISYKIIPKNLKIGEIFMKRDWKEYNKQLVKRGEIIN